MKENYQDQHNPELVVNDDSAAEEQHKREVKKRLEEILEQKRLRKSIGMDDTHNYWDEL